MAHSVGEQAARAVKNSEKKTASALRTPEERLSAIRGSVAAKLYIIPDDIRFLLELYDGQMLANQILNADLIALKTPNASQSTILVDVHPHEIDRFHDDGGAIHPEA